jgi:hypothetical protein
MNLAESLTAGDTWSDQVLKSLGLYTNPNIPGDKSQALRQLEADAAAVDARFAEQGGGDAWRRWMPTRDAVRNYEPKFWEDRERAAHYGATLLREVAELRESEAREQTIVPGEAWEANGRSIVVLDVGPVYDWRVSAKSRSVVGDSRLGDRALSAAISNVVRPASVPLSVPRPSLESGQVSLLVS